jgi:hypothetical protein
MLSRRRSLILNGEEIERTPLLIPSFSSKGFPDAQKIIEYSSEIIDGVTLVSAYDIYYGKITPPFDFPSLIFLDSGGYEAAKEAELSDFGDKEHVPKPWSQEMHEAVLAKWQPAVPSVLISYDHPKERLSIKKQIARARAMAPGRNGFIRELLLKPETEAQMLLQLPSILQNIHGLADFDVIGFTEKEIGNSIFKRMENIARLRKALTKAGLDTPLHVFGSLDTVTTPLYFLAGADIFDGLTWLRFAFHDGQTVYKHNYGATELGVKTPAHVIDGRSWNSNYYYLKEMELEMRGFLKENDFGSFKHHRDLFKGTLNTVLEAVGT